MVRRRIFAVGVALWAGCTPAPDDDPVDDTVETPDTLDTLDTVPVDDTDLPAPFCGDGRVTDGELCDDGNADDAYCDSLCRPTPPPELADLPEAVGDLSCDLRGALSLDQPDPGWREVVAQVTAGVLVEDGAVDALASGAPVVFRSPGLNPVEATSDAQGLLTVGLQACAVWEAYAEPVPGSTARPSRTLNLSFASDPPEITLRLLGEPELVMVSEAAGIAVDDPRGALAGHLVGCDGLPVARAAAVLRAADGSTPLPVHVFYFLATSEISPDPWSDPEGGFAVVGAPNGPAVLELWARVDGVLALRARAPVTVTDGELTWLDVAWGRADGVRLDPACLTPP